MKEKGVYKGRKPIARKNFDKVVTLWKNGKITAGGAMKRLDMKSHIIQKSKNLKIKLYSLHTIINAVDFLA